MTTRALERAHAPGPERWWAESWGFTFTQPDAEAPNPVAGRRTGWLGGFVEFTVLPRQRKAWFCAGIVREGRPYVLCRDHDLAAPADANVFEVRGDGLWSHAICETPGEHWTVAMEAFALAFDDPLDAWGKELGDRVGLAFDLEWEGSAKRITSEPGETPGSGSYSTPCEVNGVLQVGDDEWEIAGVGARSHRWGIPVAADLARWRSGALDAPADGVMADRDTLAVAPFLAVLADDPDALVARSVQVRRTLDRLTFPDGKSALQWTEIALTDGEPPLR